MVEILNFILFISLSISIKDMEKYFDISFRNILIYCFKAMLNFNHREIKEDRKSGNITGEIRIGPIRP